MGTTEVVARLPGRPAVRGVRQRHLRFPDQVARRLSLNNGGKPTRAAVAIEDRARIRRWDEMFRATFHRDVE